MSTRVRRASPTEAAELTELSLRAKRSNGYDDRFMAACIEELTVTTEKMQAGEYWVAESNVVQGVVCLVFDQQAACGEVNAFFVDPQWQRQGIGLLLWRQVQRQARFHQLKRLRLDADPAAVPFYESLGFQTTGHTPSGSIKGRMLPRMEIAIG